MGRRLLKELERSYGFDEVAIVPGGVTINPELTSTKMTVRDLEFEIPVMASAMDGAVSPSFANIMHEMGGLGVPETARASIPGMKTLRDVGEHHLHSPGRGHRIPATGLRRARQGRVAGPAGARDQALRLGVRHLVHPAQTKRMSPVAVEAGADMVVVQSTVTTAPAHVQQLPGPHFPPS